MSRPSQLEKETQALETAILRLREAEAEYRRMLGSYKSARIAAIRRGEKLPPPIVDGQERNDIELREGIVESNSEIDRAAGLLA